MSGGRDFFPPSPASAPQANERNEDARPRANTLSPLRCRVQVSAPPTLSDTASFYWCRSSVWLGVSDAAKRSLSAGYRHGMLRPKAAPDIMERKAVAYTASLLWGNVGRQSRQAITGEMRTLTPANRLRSWWQESGVQALI